MRPSSTVVFTIASVARELCWTCALAAFSLHELIRRPYPLADAVGIYAGSAIVARAARSKGLRAGERLLIHAALLLGVLIRSAHTAWYPAESFWKFGGWRTVSTPRTASDWLTLAALGFWSLVFWRGGMQYVRRSSTYADACSRFDKGITWLFALLFLKLLLRGQSHPEALSGVLIYPFVAFGLVAVAIARNRSSSHKRFIQGYRAIGLASSFGGLLLAFGLGCWLLCLPWLRAASGTSYAGLKAVGRPVAHAAIDFVGYLLGLLNFSPARVLPHTESHSATGSGVTRLGSRALPSATHDTKTIWIWVGAGALLALVVVLVYVRHWLSSRSDRVPRGESRWARIRSWLARLRSAIGALLQRDTAREPIRLYVALLRWGRRSGLRHRPHETPREYAERLKARRLGANDPIDLIVSVFYAHVYGRVEMDEQQMTRARRAMRQLRSPLLWPARLRTWFASDADDAASGSAG